jgi:hypothetical protein
MKKSLIFALASILMLMISCSEEQPTKFSEYVFDKRNIENDTNWVEIHDYDTLDGICFDWFDTQGGVLMNTEDEYKEVFARAFPSDNTNNRPYHCFFWTIDNYIKPDIDFEKRSMLIFSWGDALVEYKRKIYYNRNNDEYFYLLTVDLVGQGIPLRLHLEALSLPKITNSEKIKFDTIFNSNGYR